jgi:hypothetical protein
MWFIPQKGDYFMVEKNNFRVLLEEDKSEELADDLFEAGIDSGTVRKATHAVTTQGPLSKEELLEMFVESLGDVKDRIVGTVILIASEEDDKIYCNCQVQVQPAGLEPIATTLLTSVGPSLKSAMKSFEAAMRGDFDE